MTMSVIAVLQARVGSSRLRNKVLKDINGFSVLEAQMIRVEPAAANEFWIATTTSSEDDPIADLATKRNWSVFRGDSENVLSRFISIIEKSKADLVIRLTGDNPFTHFLEINKSISQLTIAGSKYWSIGNFEPRSMPFGSIAEIVRSEALLVADRQIPTDESFHRSHVTSWIHKELSILPYFESTVGLYDPTWRWTIDEQSDLLFFQKFTQLLGNNWVDSPLSVMASRLQENLDLALINKDVPIKNLVEG
jgi:spore coat polysaccharide biosynthesis protein SpsF (cytidylyltransferase family)